jgi:hypothetical protein
VQQITANNPMPAAMTLRFAAAEKPASPLRVLPVFVLLAAHLRDHAEAHRETSNVVDTNKINNK